MFQSLSGFQVRCNHLLALFGFSHFTSFNPYRVFKFAATRLVWGDEMRREYRFNPYRVFKFAATSLVCLLALYFLYVSIPIGFSSSLQPCTTSWKVNQSRSFNPYRVFKFAATQLMLL